MSGTQVLARKWRPRRFAEMVGQEHVVRALSNALGQNRLHHAWLLTGTRGVGKTTLARILAKALNCERGVSAEPCGGCGACRDIDAGRFVDLVELDAASNTQVDQMRELLENALYAPTSGRFKVYIIDEVHMLSRSAFNAMLKTLEEPPEHVKFVLATTDPQKIPVTVLSRCLQFNLKQLPPPLIAERLRYVLEQEQVAFEQPALQHIARAAQGSMRDALSLLDQAIAYGEGRVADDTVQAMLGTVDQGALLAVLDALAGQDGAEMMACAERMQARSLSFDVALQDLAALLHRIALLQAVPAAVEDDLPERARLEELARRFAPEDVQLHYQIALQGRRDLNLAPDEYAGFSMTLLRMLSFAPESEPGGRSSRRGGTAGREVNPGSAPASAAAPDTPAPRAAAAAQAPQEAGPARPAAGHGQWPDLVRRMQLKGMARVLAEHCELASIDERRVVLRVPEQHALLLEGPHQEKLVAALREQLGGGVQVSFSIGAGAGTSPAALASQAQEARQADAVAAIEEDRFVRDVIETFDARLIETSIKPLAQGG